MKRIIKSMICISFCFIFVALAGCSCDNEMSYTSYISDVSNNELEIIKTDISLWGTENIEIPDMIDQTCFFQGKEYTGSYTRSKNEKLNSYITDFYRSKDGINFGLNRSSGRLVYINFLTSDFFNTEPFLPDVENSSDFAKNLSQKIAQSFIETSSYELIIEDEDVYYSEIDSEKSIVFFEFTYAKKVEGYYSSDYISIRITSKGNVASVKVGDIGSFENISFSINSSDVEKSINNKVNKELKEYGYKVNEIKIVNQKIIKTSDGYGVFSNVSINVDTAKSINQSVLLSIITYLN